MAKADRYTADGREAIAKAREADVEDRIYQIGEISQKTGLQKTAEGWVTPKGKGQNAAIEAKGKSEKWEKNKDYLNRERISMKTPSGGSVSIYESKNPNQKNNRFRVDTGTHYNDFNTLEEAKTFAEKEYGGNNSVGAKKLSTVLSAKEFKNLNTTEKRQYLLKLYDETSKITKTKPSEFWINEIKSGKPEGLNLIYGLLPKQLLSNQNSNEDSAPRQLTGDCKITIKG